MLPPPSYRLDSSRKISNVCSREIEGIYKGIQKAFYKGFCRFYQEDPQGVDQTERLERLGVRSRVFFKASGGIGLHKAVSEFV